MSHFHLNSSECLSSSNVSHKCSPSALRTINLLYWRLCALRQTLKLSRLKTSLKTFRFKHRYFEGAEYRGQLYCVRVCGVGVDCCRARGEVMLTAGTGDPSDRGDMLCQRASSVAPGHRAHNINIDTQAPVLLCPTLTPHIPNLT